EEGQRWSDYVEAALQKMAIRRAPLWNQGLMEGLWFIRFDSGKRPGSRVLSPRDTAHARDAFLQALLCELKLREPAVPLLKEPDCRSADRPAHNPPRATPPKEQMTLWGVCLSRGQGLSPAGGQRLRQAQNGGVHAGLSPRQRVARRLHASILSLSESLATCWR